MIPPPGVTSSLEARRNINGNSEMLQKCLRSEDRSATTYGNNWTVCDNSFHGQIWKHPQTIVIAITLFTKPVQNCTEQYVQTAQQPVCTRKFDCRSHVKCYQDDRQL